MSPLPISELNRRNRNSAEVALTGKQRHAFLQFYIALSQMNPLFKDMIQQHVLLLLPASSHARARAILDGSLLMLHPPRKILTIRNFGIVVLIALTVGTSLLSFVEKGRCDAMNTSYKMSMENALLNPLLLKKLQLEELGEHVPDYESTIAQHHKSLARIATPRKASSLFSTLFLEPRKMTKQEQKAVLTRALTQELVEHGMPHSVAEIQAGSKVRNQYQVVQFMTEAVARYRELPQVLEEMEKAKKSVQKIVNSEPILLNSCLLDPTTHPQSKNPPGIYHYIAFTYSQETFQLWSGTMMLLLTISPILGLWDDVFQQLPNGWLLKLVVNWFVASPLSLRNLYHSDIQSMTKHIVKSAKAFVTDEKFDPRFMGMCVMAMLLLFSTLKDIKIPSRRHEKSPQIK